MWIRERKRARRNSPLVFALGTVKGVGGSGSTSIGSTRKGLRFTLNMVKGLRSRPNMVSERGLMFNLNMIEAKPQTVNSMGGCVKRNPRTQTLGGLGG